MVGLVTLMENNKDMSLKAKFPDLFVYPNASLLDALAAIDKNSLQTAIVVDDDYRLLGVVTDGDIRRSLLKGVALNSTISSVMNTNPKIAKEGELRNVLLRRMKQYGIHFLPKINGDNRVKDIVFFSDIAMRDIKKNKVIIMAGGRGTRLGTLTRNCPKPMLRMGGKPMLEIMIEMLSSFGFYDFIISVYYLKEQIMNHFSDGSRFGVDIAYLNEDEPLGTAGVLSSLIFQNDDPFIVINCDIYTDMDFSALLNSHYASGCEATICLREFSYQIPFGVVKASKDKKILAIEEKPELAYLINAGVYVFNPSVINLIPKNGFFLMTSLIEELINVKKSVNSYSIDGFWLDIGHQDDLERVSSFFNTF